MQADQGILILIFSTKITTSSGFPYLRSESLWPVMAEAWAGEPERTASEGAVKASTHTNVPATTNAAIVFNIFEESSIHISDPRILLERIQGNATTNQDLNLTLCIDFFWHVLLIVFSQMRPLVYRWSATASSRSRLCPGSIAIPAGLLWLSLQLHRAAGFAPAASPFLHTRAAHTLRGSPSSHRLRPARRLHGERQQLRSLTMQTFASTVLDFGADFPLDNSAPVGAAHRPVDFTTLAAVSAELQLQLPLRVSSVCQAGETDISLRLLDAAGYVAEEDCGSDAENTESASAAGAVFLELSWHRKFGRMCFSMDEPLRNSKSAFATQVEKAVGGLYLVSARPLPFSRILRLDFSSEPVTPAAAAAAEAAAAEAAEAAAAEAAALDVAARDNTALGSGAGNRENSNDEEQTGDFSSVDGDGDWHSGELPDDVDVPGESRYGNATAGKTADESCHIWTSNVTHELAMTHVHHTARQSDRKLDR